MKNVKLIQVKNDTWHKERKYRLTASNFGRVCKLRANTPRINTVKYILYSEVFTPTTASLRYEQNISSLVELNQLYMLTTFNVCRYGIQYEPMAKQAFELKLGFTVLPAGLFIDGEFNFLACTPDGLIGEEDLVEIKCPHSAKDMTIHEGVDQKKIKCLVYNNVGELQLKRTDIYYYQVQGQLHVADKQNCYFVVWTPKGAAFEYYFIVTPNRNLKLLKDGKQIGICTHYEIRIKKRILMYLQ